VYWEEEEKERKEDNTMKEQTYGNIAAIQKQKSEKWRK
jgi:hypothetical protein